MPPLMGKREDPRKTFGECLHSPFFWTDGLDSRGGGGAVMAPLPPLEEDIHPPPFQDRIFRRGDPRRKSRCLFGHANMARP